MSEPTDPDQSTQPVRPAPDDRGLLTQPVGPEPDDLDEPATVGRPGPVAVPPPAATPAEPKKSVSARAQETVSNVVQVGRILILALLGAILGIFVVRNWNDVEFDFVFGDVEMPLAFMLLIFLGIGILIGMVLYWYLRRKAGR